MANLDYMLPIVKPEAPYTLTVVRLVSSSARLTALSVSDLDDNPVNFQQTFDSDTLNYSAIVGETTTYIALSTEAEQGTIEISQAGAGEIRNPDRIEMNIGLNRILITVTAPDGTTHAYYTVSITRLTADSTNGKVTGFSIEGASLDPEFSYEDYSDWGSGIAFEADTSIAIGKIESGLVKLIITTESAAALATITIGGSATEINNTPTTGAVEFEFNTTGSGAFTGFEVDESYVMVVTITSGDGSTHVSTFTVDIDVTAGSSNADLAGLKLFWGSHNSQRVIYPGTFTHDSTYHDPEVYIGSTFDPDELEYVALAYAAETVKIVAVPDDETVSSITFNGSEGVLSGGEYSSSIMLTKGGVTTVTIAVTPGDGKTDHIKTYTLRIKLLNAYEMYWGVYGPLNNNSFARWEDLFGSQGVKTVNIPGVISGNLEWKVQLVSLRPRNTMTWTQYLDGNRDSAGYTIRVDYNDNHPTNNNLHGFMLDGSVSGLLDGITSKNGTITGAFDLYSPWGDYIGTINANYTVEGGVKVEDSDSYADFEYMGDTVRMMYRDDDDGNSQYSPFPFTSSYDWSSSWNPGSY